MTRIIITIDSYDHRVHSPFPGNAPILMIGLMSSLIEPIKKLGFSVGPAVAAHFRSNDRQHIRIEKDGIKIYEGPVLMS